MFCNTYHSQGRSLHWPPYIQAGLPGLPGILVISPGVHLESMWNQLGLGPSQILKFPANFRISSPTGFLLDSLWFQVNDPNSMWTAWKKFQVDSSGNPQGILVFPVIQVMIIDKESTGNPLGMNQESTRNEPGVHKELPGSSQSLRLLNIYRSKKNVITKVWTHNLMNTQQHK